MPSASADVSFGCALSAMQSASSKLALQLEEDGFIRLEDVATEAEAAYILSTLSRMWEKKTGFDQGYQFDLVGDDDENRPLAFPQIIHPSSFAPELLKTDFFAKAENLAKTLLGPKARFASDHALLKNPITGPETPWHQDEAFRDSVFEYREVSIWLALQPTDDENGCMQFIPGSNQRGVLPHRPLNGNERVHALQCTGDFDPSEAFSCPLPTGGCTVHTGRTLHHAGPNRSNRPRAAWVLVFELPPVHSQLELRVAGVSRTTARAERELRWQRRGGALVILWRHTARVNLQDPRQVLALLHKVSRGVLRMLTRDSKRPKGM